jgi:hypothetical protein
MKPRTRSHLTLLLRKEIPHKPCSGISALGTGGWSQSLLNLIDVIPEVGSKVLDIGRIVSMRLGLRGCGTHPARQLKSPKSERRSS